MKYIESSLIKNNPELYVGIESSESWVMKDRNILDFCKNLDKNFRVLDIGCGNGSFLSKLKEYGFNYLYGADIGNYLTHSGIEHVIIDINRDNLPHNDYSLDIVVALQVLEHLENYFLILQETTRVLKSGGLFVIAVPNPYNIFYRVKFAITGNMTGFNSGNNHLLFLTRDVFKKTYLQNFNIEKIFYNRGPIPFIGRLNRLPFINLPSRVKVMPRCEWFADRVCYVLRKKS